MYINTCDKCNQLFESVIKTDLCPLCKQFIERRFKVVKQHVRDNKGAGLYEVSDTCDVPVKQILQWVREERLFFDESSDIALPCLNCGTLIRSGEYCTDCRKKLHKTLSSAYTQKSPNNDKPKDNAPIAFHSKRRRK